MANLEHSCVFPELLRWQAWYNGTALKKLIAMLKNCMLSKWLEEPDLLCRKGLGRFDTAALIVHCRIGILHAPVLEILSQMVKILTISGLSGWM